jgi:hypothetical protein
VGGDLEFVAAATREGDEGWIPPPERVAVFDNDDRIHPSVQDAVDAILAGAVSARST